MADPPKNEPYFYENTQPYIYAINSPVLPVVFREPPSWTYCSCVEFAKWFLGEQGEAWGAARDMTPNISSPEVGVLALTNEGPGHAAVITEINDDMLTLVEANWTSCEKTTRTINVNDEKIRGFYSIMNKK